MLGQPQVVLRQEGWCTLGSTPRSPPKASTQIYLFRLHCSNYYFFSSSSPCFHSPRVPFPVHSHCCPIRWIPRDSKVNPAEKGRTVNLSR